MFDVWRDSLPLSLLERSEKIRNGTVKFRSNWIGRTDTANLLGTCYNRANTRSQRPSGGLAIRKPYVHCWIMNMTSWWQQVTWTLQYQVCWTKIVVQQQSKRQMANQYQREKFITLQLRESVKALTSIQMLLLQNTMVKILIEFHSSRRITCQAVRSRTKLWSSKHLLPENLAWQQLPRTHFAVLESQWRPWPSSGRGCQCQFWKGPTTSKKPESGIWHNKVESEGGCPGLWTHSNIPLDQQSARDQHC